MEPDNSHDKYAVAVKNQDGNLVGHVPKALSRLFHKFRNDFGELEAECIGNRLNAGKGKGVQIPVDYRLVANDSYLGKLKRKLSKKDFADDINIGDSANHRKLNKINKRSLFIYLSISHKQK